MSKLLLTLFAAAGLVLGAPASAADNAATRAASTAKADMKAATTPSGGAMSRDAYKVELERIDTAYKQDKERCDSLSGNANDVCEAETKGHHDAAKADAEAVYKNTPRARYNARMAHVDADYKVAKEKCEDLKGNSKDVCVKDAKAMYTRAKSDAKVDKVVAETRRDDASKVAAAKQDAAEDTRDAEYKAAVERCDALAHTAKQTCMKQAKAKYGRS